MTSVTSNTATYRLSEAFILEFPKEAARELENIPADEAAEIIVDFPVNIIKILWAHLTLVAAESILRQLPEDLAVDLLAAIDAGQCASMLCRLDVTKQQALLDKIAPANADLIRELMSYPLNSVGSLMDNRVFSFHENTAVADVLLTLKRERARDVSVVYLVDDNLVLKSEVEIHRLITEDETSAVAVLARPTNVYVSALAAKDEALEILEKYRKDAIPVVDNKGRIIGVLRSINLIDAMREDLTSNMQSMVGVSKEENAMSSSWFAVRKRLPWLEVNLLTAFLASAVVGMFEATIAQITALAVMLPIAAGQSGNTGAQALAVTMRGLTLREITVRDWFVLARKEFISGFVNGAVIGVTCGIGVYIWSQNLGLACVMLSAMLISMTIAGVAGAMVPIVLKKMKQDPAQSSSIILTTVTDIAGFMSFLGIATLLSHWILQS